MAHFLQIVSNANEYIKIISQNCLGIYSIIYSYNRCGLN